MVTAAMVVCIDYPTRESAAADEHQSRRENPHVDRTVERKGGPVSETT
jgi:hypothetical protein